jgi:hypothetical protein
MDAEPGRQADRGEDARDVGQAAHDRVLLGARDPFVVACHRTPFKLSGETVEEG